MPQPKNPCLSKKFHSPCSKRWKNYTHAKAYPEKLRPRNHPLYHPIKKMTQLRTEIQQAGSQAFATILEVISLFTGANHIGSIIIF